ncbi:MAG: two-component regulator propeller domain-containing protein, partial [Bacteroidia bacterium]
DKGEIWIATDGGGLNRFSPQTGRWEHYYYQSDYPSSLNTDALYDLMWDTKTNLWIGTFNGGVNLKKAYQSPFETKRKYAVERDQGLRSVLCLDQGPGGELWFGTDGGGLYCLDVSQAPVEFLPLTRSLAKILPEQVITSLVATPSGKLWLGTFAQGLRYVDTKTGELRRFQHDDQLPQSLSHNNVWDLALSQDGGLWIGTLGGGVNYLAPGTDRFQRWGSNPADSNSLSGVQILDVLLDADEQNLWIATENAGLNQLDLATHKVTQYRHSPEAENSINSDDLRCLFEDEKGFIWIGTEHAGLNVLEPQTGQFDHFDMEDGLPSNMINSIAQSLDGNLWISTQAGIVSMDMQKRTFIDIGHEPYLTNSQYNPSAALRLADGRLVFGSTNGYSLLNPTQLHINNEPPKVIFTDFSISGQSIPVGTFEERNILTADLNDSLSVVNLSYQDKEINFKFAAIDYAQTSKNQYAYRLKNFDPEWHTLDAEQRFVSFSSLAGGTYVLEIKAANGDGIWSEEARTLRLIVAPPFWETWWFILLCIILGGLLLIGSIIFALNRQKTIFRQQKLQAEREILRLKNDNLKKDIAGQQAKLSASVLQIAHKNEILNSLKGQLKTIELPSEEKAAKNLRRVLREINSELKEESYWDQFQLIFNQTHTHFVERLQKLHPQLSNNEKRLCCFIRIQLSNREIASILNVTINAVEQAKYRMKKKLNISKEDKLADYLRTIDGE